VTSINSLFPDHKNARRRTDRSASLIKESIDRYGAARSIVIDEDNRILAGNGTIEGAKAAGIKNVRIIETDGQEVIAVRRTGLTEDEKIGLALADNRTSDLSEWDQEMLRRLSEEHDISPWFNDEDLNELLAVTELPPEQGKTDPDYVPEPPVDPITKPGDLWILGNHRLLCGDSTNIQHVERLMDGKKADFCFTSPPYNAETKVGFGGSGLKNKNLYLDNRTDSRSTAEYVAFACDVVSSILAHSSDTFQMCWNVGYNKRSPADFLLSAAAINSLIGLKETIVWEKQLAISLRGDNLTRICEFVFFFSKAEPVINKGHTDCEKNLWQISNVGANEESHKACFPVALPEKGISLFAPPSALVYEPFGGSGTTLIACEKTSRHCRMMELDPAYCDVIVKRWEDFTGNTAICHPADSHFKQQEAEF